MRTKKIITSIMLALFIMSATIINANANVLHMEWIRQGNYYYWVEYGVIQGTVDDPKGVKDTQYNNTVRGREIYDPASDGWYWLDAVYDGAKAVDKEVWMPYVYQDEIPGSTDGKWVRYDGDGKMVKGWFIDIRGGSIRKVNHYDWKTGKMSKGWRNFVDRKDDDNDVTVWFDEIDGSLSDRVTGERITGNTAWNIICETMKEGETYYTFVTYNGKDYVVPHVYMGGVGGY